MAEIAYCKNDSGYLSRVTHIKHDQNVAVLSRSKTEIGSDRWDHRRAAPASCLSVKHASRHICKQLTGPFPAVVFLRSLEGCHGEADLIVPRLSLNLHVRCQLPCRSRSTAPTLTPNATHAQYLESWPRTQQIQEKEPQRGLRHWKEDRSDSS